MGDFNFPDINWEYHGVNINRSRKFLKHLEDNFLVQLLRELTRKAVFLDLLFVNREGLLVICVCLGHRDKEVAEFQILGNKRITASKTLTLSIGRAGFGLLKDLVSKDPWESTFEGVWIHEYCSFFKRHILREQEQAIPKCWKSSKRSRRLA